LSDTIRVLALMETSTLSGPAKNLIEFATRAAQPREGLPRVEISIVTFARGDIQSNAFLTAVRGAGVNGLAIPERHRFDPQTLPRLRTLVAEFRPDIIQSHNVKSNLFIRLLGLHRKFPWIAFNHGYTATDRKDRLYNQFDRWSLKAAFANVAVCRPFAQKLETYGVATDRIRVQHNSVRPFVPPPPEEVERLRSELGIGERRVVLAVGRLSYEKGHADLLQALALLARRSGPKNWCTVLVGDGPERESLTRLSSELGLRDTVIFAGYRSDVRAFYSLADLLALPSHTEGSPNVVLEAMAAGVPVVAMAVGGVPEILIHEQNGLLVPPGDVREMAAAIERLEGDEPLRSRLSAAGRECVDMRYLPETYCRTMIALYQQVLQDYRNPSPATSSS
jgi:glycosyltransferase involved in cell wall biosynthesis